MTEESNPENESGRRGEQEQSALERIARDGSLQGISGRTRANIEQGIVALQDHGIIEGYRQWIGKSEILDAGRTESIMVSCPLPEHPDKNPSAWLNSEKGVWFCGACQTGGDVVDFAAIAHSYPFPQYRDDGTAFVSVVKAACKDIGQAHALELEESEANNSTGMRDSGPVPAAKTANTSAVPSTNDDDDDDELDRSFAQFADAPLDWRAITSAYPGSFLDVWMQATHETELPDDYLFWLGLLVISLAIGRNCHFTSDSAVYPNLMLTMLGPTGSGKSRSIRLGMQVVDEAMPFDPDDINSKGVSKIGRPGSGEALYEMLSWLPPGSTGPQPMKALLEVDEMKELMQGAARRGSTLREALITMTDNPKDFAHNTRSAGSIEVREPFLSVVTGGQPDAMQDILTKNDMASGFANRFLFIPHRKKPRKPILDRVPPNLIGVADKLRLVQDWGEGHKLGRDEGSITLDQTAADHFDQMVEWIEEIRERPTGDLYSRLELYAMKLIVILCANAKISIGDVQLVKHVEALLQSTLPGADSVAEAITTDEAAYYRQVVQRVIASHRDANKRPPSRSDINRSIKSGKRDKNALGAAIRELERNGVIESTNEWQTSNRPGVSNRRVERYFFEGEEKWWEGQ